MILPDLKLTTSSLYIIWKLQEAGYEAFLVGGSVRDLLMDGMGLSEEKRGMDKFDFDYTTSAKPEEIMAVFPESFYENDFGTVSVAPEKLLAQMRGEGFLVDDWESEKMEEDEGGEEKGRNDGSDRGDRINVAELGKVHESLSLPAWQGEEKKAPNFEITTYRTGEQYGIESRAPAQMSWGETINDDLSRRDFTINALALLLEAETLAGVFEKKNLRQQTTVMGSEYRLRDNYEGVADLRAGLIRAIGQAERRFEEDPLRLLRGLRFSVQLNFGIEEETYQAIKARAELIKRISWERIRDEFLKMLGSDFPREAIMLLDETGLLEIILPELTAMKGVVQSGHHLTDVWVHSLDALAACPNRDPIVRLATLLHDVGKPETQKMTGGQFTFYNHQVVGAHMAKRIAMRLKLSKREIERIFVLVRQHMFHYLPQNTDAFIRRFMRQVGLENLNDILDLREADRLGSNARRTSWRLEEMKARMIEQLNQPMAVRDLAIDGNDLMKEFDLKPGPILGRVLGELLERVLEESELNERGKLLELAGEMVAGEK